MGFYPGKIKLERKMPACPDVIPWIKKRALKIFQGPCFYFWRRLPDSNRRITALQAVALPLGQAAVSGAGNGI